MNSDSELFKENLGDCHFKYKNFEIFIINRYGLSRLFWFSK